MSKHFAILDKTRLFRPAVDTAAESKSTFARLIDQLCQSGCVIAIIATGSSAGVSLACEEIALELGRTGKRVVLVDVLSLLQSHPIAAPDEAAFVQVSVGNVWRWPSAASPRLEFFKSRPSPAREGWIDGLRRHFDSVLLDCPTLAMAPETAAIAAMADTAVLAVDASLSSKEQILLDQRTLQLRGVSLAGCILINAR